MNNALNEKDIFSASGLPAREQVSEWINIKGKIGDKVMGTFLGWWISPAQKAGFKDQIGIALKLADGKVVGVSVGDTSYMRSRIEPSEIGDAVGLKYEGDKDTGQILPAKIVKFYNPALEERRKAGTVKVTAPEQLSKPAIAPAAGATPSHAAAAGAIAAHKASADPVGDALMNDDAGAEDLPF